jgi:cell division protein FtsL
VICELGAVILQATASLQVVVAALLVCFGLLLGASWTTQALQSRLRQQAEERRRLNEEWSAVRTARRQRGECPRCRSPSSERDWHHAPEIVNDQPDDD